MVKVIVATHDRLAEGFRHTLDYIAPGVVELVALSAYVENIPVEDELQAILEGGNADEQVVILTDLLGGSVNQACSKWIGKKNLHLIAGVNFPLLLSIALQAGQGEFSAEDIRSYLDEARNQMVYVNDYLEEAAMDDDDE